MEIIILIDEYQAAIAKQRSVGDDRQAVTNERIDDK
jgi:hypothetical protein